MKHTNILTIAGTGAAIKGFAPRMPQPIKPGQSQPATPAGGLEQGGQK